MPVSRSQTAVVTDLGTMIRSARQGLRLTQKELGDLIEFGQPAVCQWERNRARPSAKKLAELSQVLGLDLGDLTRAAGRTLEYPRGSEEPPG